MFTKGSNYRRKQLHEQYGGQEQGGICTPSMHKIVLLFASHTGEQYGYKDGWNENGLYFYTGEGQTGDMKFVRGNAAIRDHLQNGKELHLFEYTRSGEVSYVGQFVYHNHRLVKGEDKDHNIRQVIVFELKPL